ncbi:Nif3-like dinuclear metal center hexameric protein [Macrococcus equi]|uniref:Nif3-like dinuclear metal center hexameric protein n=1 Tax=Macrococcus equi TaxID=3395462 RepID=UPI0039BE8517
MKTKTLLDIINQEIPLNTAEDWDNVGLLIGDTEREVTGIITALDCTLDVVFDAKSKNVNTIICHHPLIFSGIKSIHNNGYGEIIHELIKSEINLIALHTNLDAHPQGVSAMIAKSLSLQNIEILIPSQITMYKLQVFVPTEYAEQLKSALAEVGVGKIGNYDHCFFSLKGTGEFRGLEGANPFVGNKGDIHYEEEVKIECVFKQNLKQNVIETIQSVHPYETPAFDIIAFDQEVNFGTGVKAKLSHPMLLSEFAQLTKQNLQLDTVKMIGTDKQVETVGIIGGAGVSYMNEVLKKDVDVFMTGDIKYHEAHDLLMSGQATLDISHYSEYVMKEGLKSLLEQHIDVRIFTSEINTNPFKTI